MSGSYTRVTAAAVLLTAALALVRIPAARAVSYYVSASGDNLDDGLTVGTAWRSVDNGDQLGILVPGDTVNILPGLYLVQSTISLTSSGEGDRPIVYTGQETDPARIKCIESEVTSIRIDGDNLILRHVTLTADPLVKADGIQVTGDSCTVYSCVIHSVYYDGIEISGSANLILRSIMYLCGRNGIHSMESGLANRYYGNTLWNNDYDGIQILGAGSNNRIFNNLIIENGDDGISGPADNVCGYNDVWSNPGGDYQDGVADSAGGISEDPLMADPAGRDFTLLPGSPAIDAGLDLGFSYKGPAPDLGALESTYSSAYYVSPTGDDDYDGLTLATAWLSIDNGDQKGILVPGDTVNILPGTYTPPNSIALSTAGTAAHPIVYRKYGDGDVVIDRGGQTKIVIVASGDHIRIDSLEVTGTTDEGVQVLSDSCTVRGLYIHHTGKKGLKVDGSYNLFIGNIIAFADDDGVRNEGSGEYNIYYDNTVYSNSNKGFDLNDNTSRVFNNIVVLNDKGIDGNSANVCAFNDVWGNTGGDYAGGAFDSAGGISADPLFFDPATGDFRLQCGSPAIDAGLDLGYPYHGDAPDMGATESDYCDSVAYIAVVPDTATVVEGTSLQYAAYAYTPDSILVGEVTDSVSWTMTDPSGSITSGGLYTAGHDLSPPDYYVKASYDAISDSSRVTVVTDGLLKYIRIELADGRPLADTTLTTDTDDTGLNCRGYDSGDNPLGDISVTWSLLGVDSIGTVSPGTGTSTTLTLSRPGTGRVVATHSPTIKDTSGVITCVAGEPVELVISPDTATVSADSTLEFTSQSFDADGNLSSPQVVPDAWEVLGGIGSIDSTGLFTAATAGTGNIVGAGGSLVDTTGTIEVIAGEVAWIDVTPATSVVIEGASEQHTANGYDADSNFVRDLTDSVAWATTDPSGSITTGGLYTAGHDLSPPDYHVSATYAAVVDSAVVTVVTDGTLSYILVELDGGRPFPDTTLTTDHDTTAFYCRGYDSGDNLIGDIAVAWSLIGTDSIGTINPGPATTTTLGLFRPGTGQVVGSYGPGVSDTTGTLTCVAGAPDILVISPDTVTTLTGGTVQFATSTSDADGNPSAPVTIDTWEVLGGIGTISGTGLLTATTVGTGSVACSGGGLADTTGAVTVLASGLKMLAVTPDTATLKIAEAVQFTATGFNEDFEPVPVGDLTWQVLGGIGSIDPSGMFTAASAGVGYISAMSALGGVGDMTSMIIVEIPAISEVALGNGTAHAGASGVPVLAFRISNAFDGPEQLEGITLRDASRGRGTVEQVLSSIDSLSLYVDSNASGRVDPSDTLIAGTDAISSTVDLSFPPVMIGPGSSRTFLVTAAVGDFPCDGDSLDFFILPSTDVDLAGGTPLAGPDTVNSLGRCILDGMVSDQLALIPTGIGTLSSDGGLANVLVVDIPRNGYDTDFLEIFSVLNAGTAEARDLGSLSLYMDDGNGTWNGPEEEAYIGDLSFTGDRWELSGLSLALTGQVTRFYLGVILSASATNGGTLSLGIPMHGLEMSSENDGPIDKAVGPVETITIASTEMVLAGTTLIETRELTPGEATGPITAIEMVNRYAGAVYIDSMCFTNAGSDPGGASQDDLDSQVDTVALWLEGDGSLATHGLGDSLLASGELHQGKVTLSPGGLPVPPAGGAVTLTVECTLNRLACKNVNLFNLAISESADIHFSDPVTISGTFPLKNDEDFVITTFPASNITVHDVPGGTIFGGETAHLVFDFDLPRNGYASDHLQSLRLVNTGSSNEENALDAVKLWSVSGGLGSGQNGILIGEFERGDGSWLISDLAFPLTDTGNRFQVTVDVTADDFEGGTLSFEIPIQGAIFASGTDGPDDSSVGATESHLLFPANRITVIPIPADAAAVRPGALKAPVLTFALYNGYPVQTHVLEAVRLSNRSRSVSTEAFADHMLGQVSLYYDQNANRSFDDDILIASGYFTAGNLSLSGLNISLPPESLSYFFVAANLPLDVIDSDTLDVAINKHSDFTFGQTVNLNGDLPLSRGGLLTIDGSVRDQYAVIHGSAHTVSPGDTAVTLLAFRPALNGDRTDVLETLFIENGADADTSDFRSLMLWCDTDFDEVYQPTDSLLAEASYDGEEWLFEGIGLEVAGVAPVLFITGDVTAWATPNSSFRPVIPVGGCQYASANDGPLDAPLGSEHALVVSTSGLKLTYDVLQARYSVGQAVEVSVHATNILPTTMYDVYCDISGVGEPGIVSLDSSSVARGVLAPGGTADFRASYTTLGAGTAHWRVQAFSSSPVDSSAPVETEPVVIQTVPAGVLLQMVSSIPTAVTRGQRQVFPLSIKYRHSMPSPTSASIRLDGLRLRVEDESGLPIDAATVFSRMVLATGYTNLTILESLPADPTVVLTFSQPTVVEPGDEQVLSLQVDIDSLAGANSFALVIDSADGIEFTDFNTGGPVAIDPAVGFPLKTSACRINNASHRVALSYVSGLSQYANYGQADVDIVQLVLRHPGTSEDSQVQLSSLSFGFRDESQSVVPADEIFDRIRLMRREAVLGQWSGAAGPDSLLNMWLSAPPVLSPGEVDTLRLEGSINAISTHSAFELTIPDSTRFVLRDLSSGGTVTATSDTGAAGAGIFPITSGITRLKYPAVAPEVCLASGLPPTVIAGSDSVTLMDVAIGYPAGSERSSIRVERLRVAVLDTLERAIDPYRLFDRIGFCILGGQSAYESSIELDGGYTVFHLGSDGVTIEPGANAMVRLLADVEADTPFDNFTLRVYRQDGLAIVDATDRNHHPGFVDAPECEALFPFTTAMTRILLPAGNPTISVDPMPVAIAFPGREGHTFFTAELSYPGGGQQGDLLMQYWGGRVLRRGPAGFEPVSGDQVFKRVRLLSDGQPIAVDSSFAGDSLLLRIDEDYILSSGDSKMISLTCDIKQDAALGNYVVEFGDSSFAGFVDRDLTTAVYVGLAGGDYPILTGEVSVTAGDLARSFCNWPNPFNPAREATTIGYVLSEDAYVDMEIFTITGELVRTIVAGAHRSAGAHDEDMWAGANDGGLAVLPGTYFLRITARYASGSVEDVKRKVAVIR